MIQHFRAFSAILMTAVLAAPIAAAAQAPAAPAAPARGPRGSDAACGPGVTGKNIASDSRCFELRTYTVEREGPGSIDLLHDAVPRAHQPPVPQARHDNRRLLAAAERGHGTTLIYVLAYKERAARDAAWNAFRNDPEWTEVTTKMQVGATVESVFMNSTDYGPMK